MVALKEMDDEKGTGWIRLELDGGRVEAVTLQWRHGRELLWKELEAGITPCRGQEPR